MSNERVTSVLAFACGYIRVASARRLRLGCALTWVVHLDRKVAVPTLVSVIHIHAATVVIRVR